MPTEAKAQSRWWSDIRPYQWRTLTASWVGWVLDAFDFTFTLLVLGSIGKTFGVSLAAMGLVVTATLFCRFIGGILVGTWADRVGRRLPMMMSIIAFSIFEFLSGFAPTYTIFLVLRMLFGMGMGGEWAAGTPLLMESWPQESRGHASGILQSGWPTGYLLATLIYFVVFPIWGWRALFFIGVLPALLVLFIRSRVSESPVWRARREILQQEGKKDSVSLPQLFRREQIGATLHASLCLGVMMFSYYALNSYWPTFLTNTLGLSVGQKTFFLVLMNLASIVGLWGAGALSQRIGRRMTIVIFSFLGLLFVPLYCLTLNHTWVLIGGILEGILSVGMFGVAPAYLSERFPTAIRGAGTSFGYHAGAAIGSFAPTVEALLQVKGLPLSQSMAIGAAVALVCSTILVFFGPETKSGEFAPEH